MQLEYWELSKRSKFGFFFEKIDGFFEKKLEFFLKPIKVVNLKYNVDQMILFRKYVFSALLMRFFWQKIAKLWKLLEKLEKMMKSVFFEKKNVFIFLKAFFTKMGRRRICRWQHFSKVRLKWYFFLKKSFHFISDFFWQKSEKILGWKSLKIWSRNRVFWKKKNAFILLKGIFNNVGGCKISRRLPGVLL